MVNRTAMPAADCRSGVFRKGGVGWRAAVTVGLLFSATAPALAQPSLRLFGLPENGVESWVSGISFDGSVVAGYTNIAGTFNSLNFRWTADSGRQDDPSQTGKFLGLSPDGSTIVGVAGSPFRLRGGVREYVQEPQPGPQGWMYSSGAAYGASWNGDVVAGSFSVVQRQERGKLPFVSRSGSPTEWLGWPGGRTVGYTDNANDVSYDGSVVVGAIDGFAQNTAFRWTQQTQMEFLPSPPDVPPYSASTAYTVSGDGRVIGGGLDFAPGNAGIIWTDGIAERVAAPYGWRSLWIHDLSSTGAVRLGSMQTLDNSAFGQFIWTEEDGAVEMREYFRQAGLGIAPTAEIGISRISGDGRSFAGRYSDPVNGVVQQGFVITIPSVSSLALFLLCPFSMVIVRRHRR